METATTATSNTQLLTVSDAARMLGVHANTVRSWTDQGVLACLRINSRGDRRYARQEIARFLAQTEGIAPTQTANPTNGLLTRSAALAVRKTDARSAAESVVEMLCKEKGYTGAALVAPDSSSRLVFGAIEPDERLAARAAERHAVLMTTPRRRDGRYQAALPFGDGQAGGGVVLLAGTATTRDHEEPQLLAAVAAQLDVAVALSGQIERLDRRHHRAELLFSIDDDLGARRDPDRVLAQLVEKAVHAFGAQHAGVFLTGADGSFKAKVTRNLSAEYCQILEHATTRPLTTLSLVERRAVTAADASDDPRYFELRTAIRREGFNTIAVAPLITEDKAFGVLCLYHDERHEWSEADLALLERLARHGAAVMRSAQDYSQMAKWTAQLQSIQQLGARLTRLRSVAEVGQAICAELVQLIDTHNTRVYRVIGGDCEPVAWRGQIGEYDSEDSEQLRLKVGEGMTGWVARFGLAQNVGDAAHDKRALTIPGTEDDLDESLLLAPMLYEDNVLGVIVLAKLGLNQFTADDLRLLEIYASIAAQAMANADATEQLHAQSETLARQVSSQRELLRVTESILGTLDTQALLEEIAERLNTLVEVDNLSVMLHDATTDRLNTIFAVGVHAEKVRQLSLPTDDSVSGNVLRNGEAVLVSDELAEPRLARPYGLEPRPGALIVAPLRNGERVHGVLALERLGGEAAFTNEEFELVKLFAAHVSIALRNAAQHRAVELRAETDRLTGLWNHGALTEHLERLVERGARFGMLMVDLDRFKEYNDQNGHQAGNVMLQRVADRLRASCRDSDLVFRFGGDEFALLLPGTGLPGARTVAAKVNEAIAAIEGQNDLGVTCSVGVAAFPRDARDAASIILAADRACYAAKRSGRNRIATAAEGLALASDFQPTEPTPMEPQPAFSAA
ncbi:MAG TPA: GAF domain-containing protein [Candidatus Limnocylindrales bacterium]|jgi:diguanylate cyclase (GGDEF)-like protein/excisionase family DNA binding protein